MRNLYRSMLMVILLLFTAASADALNCFDRSPTTKDKQNPYPPLKIRELTEEENAFLEASFKSLHGDWQGTGEYEVCRGTYDSPEQEITRYNLRARLETDHYGSLTMRVEAKAVRGVSSLENFTVYLSGNELRAGDYTDRGQVELIEVSPTSVTYRQLELTQGVALKRETFTTMRMSPAALSIERTFYFQGRLVGRKIWRLAKD